MKIGIFTGEVSGDNYAAILAKNINEINPDIEIFGTGGKILEKVGVEIIKGMPVGYMGYSSVILKLPSYLKFFKKVIYEIEKRSPDIIVFIDNPAFNLKVAEKLKGKFFNVYYIPPKIWAHNYKRIKKIKKYINFVIPIFPFEENIYKKEGIKCTYFGHPVVDLIKKGEKRNKEKTMIGILPGSRIQEVYYTLPVILDIVYDLKKEIDFDVGISSFDEEIEMVIKKICKRKRIEFEIFKGFPYTLIENSDLILSTSGTVNLEVALLLKPLIVFYKTSFLNYLIGRCMVKLNMVSPVNLFIGENVVPEYIQKIPKEKVKKDIIDLIGKKEMYQKEIKSFKYLKEKIGQEGVSKKVAEFILELTKGKK